MAELDLISNVNQPRSEVAQWLRLDELGGGCAPPAVEVLNVDDSIGERQEVCAGFKVLPVGDGERGPVIDDAVEEDLV